MRKETLAFGSIIVLIMVAIVFGLNEVDKYMQKHQNHDPRNGVVRINGSEREWCDNGSLVHEGYQEAWVVPNSWKCKP